MAGQFELGSKHIECAKLAALNIAETKQLSPKETAKAMLEYSYGFLPSESQVYEDYLGMTLSVEEISKVNPSVASILIDQIITREIIKKYGSPNNQNIINPKSTYAVLCSESGMASFSETSSKASRDSGKWTINGKKQISNCQMTADAYLVFAKDEEGLVRVFMIPEEQVSIEIIHKNIASSNFSLSQATVNTVVGDDAHIGIISDEFEFVQTVSRTMIAANAVGIAHSALIASIGVAKEVKNTGGQSISSSQNLQFTLADMFSEIEASRLLTYYSANSIDEKSPSIKLASMAKVKASEIAAKTASGTMQVLGNIGYIANTEFAELFASAANTQVKGGTNRNQINKIYQYMLAKK